MAKQTSVNLDITPNADGFTLIGGTTPRTFDISGQDIVVDSTGLGIGIASPEGVLHVVDGESEIISDNTGIIIERNNDSSGPPILTFLKTSASDASNDIPGAILFTQENSVAAVQTWAQILPLITNVTDAAESSNLVFTVLDTGVEQSLLQLKGADQRVRVQHASTGTLGPSLEVYHQKSGGSVTNDTVGQIKFTGANPGEHQFGRIDCKVTDDTSSAETSELQWYVNVAGNSTQRMVLKDDAMGIGINQPLADLHVFSLADTSPATLILESNVQSDSFGGEVARIDFIGEDENSATTTYGRICCVIVDNINTTEDGRIDFDVMTAGTLTTKMTVSSNSVGIGTTSPSALLHLNTDSTSRSDLSIENNANTAAQEIGRLGWYGLDDGAGSTEYGRIVTTILDPAAGSEDAQMSFHVINSGNFSAGMRLTDVGLGIGNIVPLHEVQVRAADGNPATLMLESITNGENNPVATILFSAQSAGGASLVDYAEITGKIGDNTDGAEEGYFFFDVMKAGSLETGMYLNSTGLMIGDDLNITLGPDAPLHVFAADATGASFDANTVIAVENSTDAYIQIIVPAAATELGLLLGRNDDTNDIGAGVIFNSTDGLELRTGTTARITIDSGGKVSIGGTTPVGQLEVGGTGGIIGANTNTASTSFISLAESLGDGLTPFAIQRFGSTHATRALEVEFTSNTDADFVFTVNSLCKLTMGANGVGTDAAVPLGAGTLAPDTDFHVNRDDGNTTTIRIQNNAATDDADIGAIEFQGLNDNGSPEDIIYASIFSEIVDASDGSEDGRLELQTMEGGTLTTQLVASEGAIWIQDGVTAPSSTTGFAKIYVDTADGDLKIIFADGTVKTIVVDT